jgi:hypothetical protein
MPELDITQILRNRLSYFLSLYHASSWYTLRSNALGNPQCKTRTSFRDLGEALAAASG